MQSARSACASVLGFFALTATCLPMIPSVAIEDSSTGARLATDRPTVHEYRLRMYHVRTGESIDVAYRKGTQPLHGGMGMLNHFLRDWRSGQPGDYPVQEFDLLHALLEKLHRGTGVINIICGYRSPETNRALRGATPASGVAENSQHMLSHAIDIAIPGVSTRQLRDAALSLGMGGVGFYPRSHFVHVDVGPVRQWSFGGSRVQRSLHVHGLARKS